MGASDSPINAPHPDDTESAEDFFGLDEEETQPTADDPVEVENAPDPADFDPTRGDFGGDGEADTGEVVSVVSDNEVTPEPPEADTADAPDAEPDPTSPAESAGPTDSHGQPVSEGVAESAVEEDPQPEPSPTTPGDGETASANGKKSSSTEREYLVLQKVPLTEKVLKHLLAQVEAGEAPAPRLAYFELHRPIARNVNGAITAAYNANQKTLGTSGADLAAVSAQSFQERHVEPKQVVETALSIS